MTKAELRAALDHRTRSLVLRLGGMMMLGVGVVVWAVWPLGGTR